MKQRNFMLVIMILLALFVSDSMMEGKSPFSKGKILVSGGFKFSSDKTELEDERLTTVQFDPSLNYFVVPGFSIGINISLERLSMYDSSITQFGIGPQVYYFFGSKKKSSNEKGRVYPYLGLAYLIKSYTWKESDPYYYENYSETLKGSSFKSSFGVTYMVSGSVGFFGEAVYELYSWDNLNGNVMNLVLGFKIFL